LQGNGLFNTEAMEYLPALEKVIILYKEKANEYVQKVDEITEQRIMEESKSRPLYIAKEWNERFANTFKSEFNQQTSQIDEQRNNQYLQYTQLEKENTTNQEYVITPEQIGKHTICVPTPLKRATFEREGDISQTNEVVKY